MNFPLTHDTMLSIMYRIYLFNFGISVCDYRMQDWLNETDRFLANNRRKVLDGKGYISRDAAVKKVGMIYEEFRKKQDAEYVSEFNRQTEKYLKGE